MDAQIFSTTAGVDSVLDRQQIRWWKPCESSFLWRDDGKALSQFEVSTLNILTQRLLMMIFQSRIMLCAVALTLGCSSGQDSGGDDCFSGDIDGLGTDTGNIPQLYGNWTTTFGARSFHDECNIEGLDRSDFDWLNGGAMEIGGRLDDVEVTFAGAQDADLKATMSSFGGVTISGRYTFRGEELHIAMGGLLFENSQLSITELEGHATWGLM